MSSPVVNATTIVGGAHRYSPVDERVAEAVAYTLDLTA
jgi:hypothetical protein